MTPFDHRLAGREEGGHAIDNAGLMAVRWYCTAALCSAENPLKRVVPAGSRRDPLQWQLPPARLVATLLGQISTHVEGVPSVDPFVLADGHSQLDFDLRRGGHSSDPCREYDASSCNLLSARTTVSLWVYP